MVNLSAFGVEHISKRSKDDRKRDVKIAGAAVATGAGATALAPVKTNLPDNSHLNIKTGDMKVSDLKQTTTFRGRRLGNDVHQAKLTQSIRDNGYDRKQPINVRQYRDGSYALRGGHHRLEAMDALGKDTIPVEVTQSKRKQPFSRVPMAMVGRYRDSIIRNRKRPGRKTNAEIDATANKKVPKWAEKLNSMQSKVDDFNRTNKVGRHSVRAAGAVGVAGAGALAYKKRDKIKAEFKKADKEHVGAGVAAAGGAAVGTAAYTSGYAGKKIVEYKRLKHDEVLRRTPEGRKQRKAEGKLKHEHNKKYAGNRTQLFRNWPKELPGAKLQRFLGHTHAGKTGLATGATLAGAGATGSYLAYKKLSDKEPVKKGIDDGISRLGEALMRDDLDPRKREKLKADYEKLVKLKETQGSNPPKEAPKPKPAPKPEPKPAPTPAPKAPAAKPPSAIIRGAKAIKSKGVYVPATTIAASGAIGYGASKYSSNRG